MRLVFVHGWALGPECWDLVSPLLKSFPQARVDLGYFGAPRLPDPHPGDILIGHSAGFLWGLRQRADWAGMVAINSFSRFCLDAQGRGCVKPAALRAMQAQLARDAEECVRNFRASIGAPAPPELAEAAPLAQGLELLRSFDVLPHLGEKPLLVLATKDDALAPAREAENLAQGLGASLFFSEKGGHGLPWAAPEFCAGKIEKFLQAQ
ncbi:alpha/beta fold hydrolase [Rhodoblastus sp.]|uniref:alpha/beta fold hydrolase n=1 Tax=Rhodoblastus sp. TaxID=1962975 RepID=UPI003F9D3479